MLRLTDLCHLSLLEAEDEEELDGQFSVYCIAML